jgi:hypothetical protein
MLLDIAGLKERPGSRGFEPAKLDIKALRAIFVLAAVAAPGESSAYSLERKD